VVVKLISGGQTGGDQATIHAGRHLGLATGGTAPLGWRTDVGPAPWLAGYGLVQHTSSAYPPRTGENVRNSDGTLIFGWEHSPGCALTVRYCDAMHKPYLVVPWPFVRPWEEEKARLNTWIAANRISILNGAGNRERSRPGIFEAGCTFLYWSLWDSSSRGNLA
jgi:putative molybdenum carrier protein